VKLLQKNGKSTDPVTRQQLAWAYSHVEIMRFQGLKLLSEVLARKEPGPAASINKMFWSEYAQKFSNHMMNARGAEALLIEDDTNGQYVADR
jgi:alkylation response protein AidB-like acyl-CoA dehydrogenase